MTDLISLFSYPSHMSLYDGCMTVSSRDKIAFKIVPQMIHIIHKPIGNKGITYTFQIMAEDYARLKAQDYAKSG